MNEKTYIKLTGFFFGVGMLIHLLRVIFGWTAMLGSWEVPIWLSIAAVVAAGYLCYTAFRLSK